MSDLVERLRAKIDRRSDDDCWPWTGAKFANGYGRWPVSRHSATTAHRALWAALHGTINPDIEVCHRCDNRICCNPAHLFLGTPKDNALDKVSKGRQSRIFGDKNAATKLSVTDVIAIRTSPEAHRALGRRYKVSEGTIRFIRKRETWSHV